MHDSRQDLRPGGEPRRHGESWRGLPLAAIAAGVLALAGISTMIMNGQTTGKATETRTELATFGGGCFWCVEAVYQRLDGVKRVVSGYAGGKTPNPSYEEVCSGLTGHAEAVQIEFDPARVSFERLLETFWQAHDPTTLNRQGADVGTQYRSVIFYHNDSQKAAAEKSKQAAQHHFRSPIVTEIVPFTNFYAAEKYHQDYYNRNGSAPYCSFVIKPKLEKLEKSGTIPKP